MRQLDFGWGVLVGIAGVAAASCATRREPTPHALDAKDEAAWRTRLTEQRAERDRELATSVTSPLAGVVRFAPTAAAFLAIEGDAFVLADQPGAATLVAFEPVDAARWTWRPTRAEVTAASSGGKQLLAAGAVTEPTQLHLSDRFTAVAQMVSGALVVAGFDSKREDLVGFKQLTYFAPDPRFVVATKLERLASPTPIDLTTSRGLKKPFVRYAMLHFEVDGQPCTLTAFRSAGSTERGLFVPFRDATSGHDSYGAARFLDFDEPDGGEMKLDFNEAYNPLCAYSPAFNCPLPPVENQLTVAVAAGERAYSHGH